METRNDSQDFEAARGICLRRMKRFGLFIARVNAATTMIARIRSHCFNILVLADDTYCSRFRAATGMIKWHSLNLQFASSISASNPFLIQL